MRRSMSMVARCVVAGLSATATHALSLASRSGPPAAVSPRSLSAVASAVKGLPEIKEEPIALTPIEATLGPALSSWSGDLLILPFWQVGEDAALELTGDVAALDAKLDGALTDVIADHTFKGAASASAVVSLPRSSPVRRLAIVGLGNETAFTASGAKKLGAFMAATAKAQKAKAMAAFVPEGIEPPMQQTALEAAYLALSPDTRYKSDKEHADNKPPPLESIVLLGGADEAAVTAARKIAAGVLMTRGLVGSPANYLTPATMAETAEKIAALSERMSLTVLEKETCEEMGMGSYLGVSQGAINRPKFIHLTYTPEGAVSKKVVLVGKGLTFDSGGYNIKVAMMEKMKFDMGGAGAVLGTARVVAETAPPGVEVHFIVAACENMVSAEAMRPGDVLTASNGKTIEVLNTDAEGRLTLADALVYAEKLEPDAIVDIATLTGACMISLGMDYAGLWASDDGVADTLLASAKKTGELLWRMPLADEYKEQLKSPIADMTNLGAREGGAITAALFLREFVKDTPWAHIDIAGPVWNNKDNAATGYAVRMLNEFVRSYSTS